MDEKPLREKHHSCLLSNLIDKETAGLKISSLWAVHILKMTVKCMKLCQVLKNPRSFFNRNLHKVSMRDTVVNLGVNRWFATHYNGAKVGKIFNCYVMEHVDSHKTKLDFCWKSTCLPGTRSTQEKFFQKGSKI